MLTNKQTDDKKKVLQCPDPNALIYMIPDEKRNLPDYCEYKIDESKFDNDRTDAKIQDLILSDFMHEKEEIIIKAKKRAINIKSLKSLYNQFQETEIKQFIFKNAMDLLFKLVDKAKLPRYVEDRELLQLMLFGKYYLKKGEPGFERVIEESYGGIIYDIICKLIPDVFCDLTGKNYIGRTHKSKFDRLKEHIEISLNPYENHSRKIEKAIIKALKQEFNIYGFWEEYQQLSTEMKRKVLQKLIKLLLDKYFDIDIIEVHNNYYTTYKREKYYIKNYEHYVNGKLTKGTKEPNGLNMIISSGPRKYISLPMYDIAFMIGRL